MILLLTFSCDHHYFQNSSSFETETSCQLLPRPLPSSDLGGHRLLSASGTEYSKRLAQAKSQSIGLFPTIASRFIQLQPLMKLPFSSYDFWCAFVTQNNFRFAAKLSRSCRSRPLHAYMFASYQHLQQTGMLVTCEEDTQAYRYDMCHVIRCFPWAHFQYCTVCGSEQAQGLCPLLQSHAE